MPLTNLITFKIISSIFGEMLMSVGLTDPKFNMKVTSNLLIKYEAQTALFKDPVRTVQQTFSISVIKTNQFML